MKKTIFITTAILVTLINIVTYLNYPFLLESMDYKIKDQLFRQRGDIPTTKNVVIVDIDEQSLTRLGHWPWSRDKLAVILNNLTKAKAGMIGFDIFFPEKTPKDHVLAKALLNSPSILGYYFDLKKEIKKNRLPNLRVIFIQKHMKNNYLIKAKGFVSNIPILQTSAYSGGFLNTVPDTDGIIRKSPLLIQYDQPYTSLAFEMFRIAANANKIIINYSPAGIDNVEIKNYKIPTDRFGRLYLNFRGKKGTFKYISASDVYYGSFNKNDIKGKFVLIGSSAAGLFDMKSTPLEVSMPGVEIQATLLDNLLKGDFLKKPDTVEFYEIIVLILYALFLSFVIYRFHPLVSFLTVLCIFALTYYITYRLFLNGILIDSAILFIELFLIGVLYIINYLFELKNAQKIKKALEKKVSKHVMVELLKHKNDKILDPLNREVTIFFNDIRGFTSLSENIKDPQKLISILNELMTPLSEIIINHEGTIDKYIGDSIMAYWNAPIEVENHSDKAVLSAIEQIKILKQINSKIKKEYNLNNDINIGIGINTANVTVGEMGTTKRADYTIIGDGVNLASRVEGLNKTYHTQIIITQFTYDKLKGNYIIKELDKIKVQGKNEPVKIYEVLIDKPNFLELHHKALNLYYNGEFKKAKEIFERIKTDNPLQYNMYINRCIEYISNPDNFDGVYVAKTK